jgi:hypothetical protein
VYHPTAGPAVEAKFPLDRRAQSAEKAQVQQGENGDQIDFRSGSWSRSALIFLFFMELAIGFEPTTG